MIVIERVIGREVIDSRGNPTVEAEVYFNDGTVGIADVPSGASTGIYEAVELRDNDERYLGKGVTKAVDNINNIINSVLVGKSPFNQKEIDRLMIEADGTNNKGKLGANAILAVSLAVSKAAAYYGMSYYTYIGGISGNTMPIPMMNILNGGAHSKNSLDTQEFMILPVGASSFGVGVRRCCEVYNKLAGLLNSKGLSTAVGDEGEFAPDLASEEWCDLIQKYPIFAIEDPLDEEDFEGWRILTEKIGDKVILVGDDLFVTNVDRLRTGINEKLGNAILIKPNQICSLSETIEAIKMAKANGFKTIMSHRSGETEDTSIADLAVGLNTGLIKTGAPCRGERTAKYNRLIRIEDEITG